MEVISFFYIPGGDRRISKPSIPYKSFEKNIPSFVGTGVCFCSGHSILALEELRNLSISTPFRTILVLHEARNVKGVDQKSTWMVLDDGFR